MLFEILFFPIALIGWIISGVFGFVGWLFSILFGALGGALSFAVTIGLVIGGIALCASIVGSIFGIPLLILGVLLVFRGFWRG